MYLMHLDDRLRQLPGSRCHGSILRWNVTDTSPTFHLISGLYYLFQGRRIVWIEGGVTGILRLNVVSTGSRLFTSFEFFHYTRSNPSTTHGLRAVPKTEFKQSCCILR